MSSQSARILFLGLDGGTMAVLRPAFERGWMPRLAAFWRRSATGTLDSTRPMVTPTAWTSFATGCTPLTHGIHDFNYLDPRDQTVRSNHSGRVRVPTLWHILSQAGGSVASLHLPMTYPPLRVRGLVVSGADAPSMDRAFALCPDFRNEVRAAMPHYTHKLAFKRRPATLEALKIEAARCRAIFKARAQAALLADARVDWIAMMVHFHDLDSLQHRMWPNFDVDETGVRQPEWNEEVVGCLRALDAAVGRLLELAESRDAAVVAVSDHGFGPCESLIDVNGLLQKAGLQRRQRFGTRFRYRAVRIAERYQRWRARRQPGGVAPPMARPLKGQIACDWKRTIAFAPFGQLCGHVFLNPSIVRNEAVADRMRQELLGLFREARHPERGDLLFDDVFSVADRHGVDSLREGLPDVLALSPDGYQPESKWPARFARQLTRSDWNLPATHRTSGVLAINAPGVRPGERLDAGLLDVAPTVLALLGLEIPGTMEGRVLHEAFTEPLDYRIGQALKFNSDPGVEALLGAGLGAESD